MKSRSKKRTPNIVNLTVKRRYLTEREVERLMDCARKHGRYGHRDATMILAAYRHGLRASEVCDLQWHQIELSEGRLHVHRVKNGIPSVHPIRGDEMRALRKLRRDYPTCAHVFVSERGGPISPIGFHRLIQRLGEAAKVPFPIHPHMLRHACGFKLANDGHDTRALQHYLGTRTSSTRSDTPKWRPTGSRTFGEADLRPWHLGAAASGRRQARDDFRFPLDHLGICRRIALRNQLLDDLDRALNLLVRHRLDAAGMLEF
jgi:integrase